MTEKVVGYTLLGVGLLIIVFAAVNAFMVFTGKAQPVQLFNFPAISIDIAQSLGGSLPAGLAPKPTQIVSADMINVTSNLFAQIFLMGFLAMIGEKLANLGVQLVRPIVVKSKEEKL